MEEREQDNEDNNIIDITTAQFFTTPHKAFPIKKNKKTDEKKGDDVNENSELG